MPTTDQQDSTEETTGTPAYLEQDEYRSRVAKLDDLRAIGIDPYPHHYEPTIQVTDLLEQYKEDRVGDSEAGAEGSTPSFIVAGRLVLFRSMGKNAFGHIQDGTGRLQIMFNRDCTSIEGYTPEDDQPKAIKIIEKKIDLGDWVGIEGHLFRTGKGELTLFAKKVTLLSKALLPLADKHAGLADKETRYRKRWLDLISNEEVRDRFVLRSKIFHIIRTFFHDKRFMEVETPVLQSLYGGAEARPFETKLNALDQEMFMRISLELPLKKLLVGGMDRIFEIGRVFRNEGIDRNHNPEFTLLEAYAAYWDYHDMMEVVEQLYETIAKEIFGTTKLKVMQGEGEITIDVAAPWKRMTMKESIQQYGKVDIDSMDDDALRAILVKKGQDAPSIANKPRGLLIADLFEALVEHHLIQPHHITDHPIETTPLCKEHRRIEEKEAGLVERFESFIQGQEICNSYSELNDPIQQRKLLELQQGKREAGDAEAPPLDEEFMEAICQGMPPAGGLGIGLDRLVMLFTNSSSIRDVLYFPWMR